MSSVPKSPENAEDAKSSGSTVVLSEMKEPELTLDDRMDKQGVPKAEVIEDVPAYLKKKNLEVAAASREIQELYNKYKKVESAIQEKRSRIISNVPDFENSLNYIDMVQKAKDAGKSSVSMLYKLEENAFQRAKVVDLEKVVLLLGANTFAEFSLDEAKELLQSNVNGINKIMASSRDELNWVRDQITTCEVSLAHIYNYNVQQKAGQPKA